MATTRAEHLKNGVNAMSNPNGNFANITNANTLVVQVSDFTQGQKTGYFQGISVNPNLKTAEQPFVVNLESAFNHLKILNPDNDPNIANQLKTMSLAEKEQVLDNKITDFLNEAEAVQKYSPESEPYQKFWREAERLGLGENFPPFAKTLSNEEVSACIRAFQSYQKDNNISSDDRLSVSEIYSFFANGATGEKDNKPNTRFAHLNDFYDKYSTSYEMSEPSPFATKGALISSIRQNHNTHRAMMQSVMYVQQAHTDDPSLPKSQQNLFVLENSGLIPVQDPNSNVISCFGSFVGGQAVRGGELQSGLVLPHCEIKSDLSATKKEVPYGNGKRTITTYDNDTKLAMSVLGIKSLSGGFQMLPKGSNYPNDNDVSKAFIENLIDVAHREHNDKSIYGNKNALADSIVLSMNNANPSSPQQIPFPDMVFEFGDPNKTIAEQLKEQANPLINISYLNSLAKRADLDSQINHHFDNYLKISNNPILVYDRFVAKGKSFNEIKEVLSDETLTQLKTELDNINPDFYQRLEKNGDKGIKIQNQFTTEQKQRFCLKLEAENVERLKQQELNYEKGVAGAEPLTATEKELMQSPAMSLSYQSALLSKQILQTEMKAEFLRQTVQRHPKHMEAFGLTKDDVLGYDELKQFGSHIRHTTEDIGVTKSGLPRQADRRLAISRLQDYHLDYYKKKGGEIPQELKKMYTAMVLGNRDNQTYFRTGVGGAGHFADMLPDVNQQQVSDFKKAKSGGLNNGMQLFRDILSPKNDSNAQIEFSVARAKKYDITPQEGKKNGSIANTIMERLKPKMLKGKIALDYTDISVGSPIDTKTQFSLDNNYRGAFAGVGEVAKFLQSVFSKGSSLLRENHLSLNDGVVQNIFSNTNSNSISHLKGMNGMELGGMTYNIGSNNTYITKEQAKAIKNRSDSLDLKGLLVQGFGKAQHALKNPKETITLAISFLGKKNDPYNSERNKRNVLSINTPKGGQKQSASTNTYRLTKEQTPWDNLPNKIAEAGLGNKKTPVSQLSPSQNAEILKAQGLEQEPTTDNTNAEKRSYEQPYKPKPQKEVEPQPMNIEVTAVPSSEPPPSIVNEGHRQQVMATIATEQEQKQEQSNTAFLQQLEQIKQEFNEQEQEPAPSSPAPRR